MLFPTFFRIKQFGGGLSKIKNKYYFMSLHFMLFPTFLVRVINAKIGGIGIEGGGRDGRGS